MNKPYTKCIVFAVVVGAAITPIVSQLIDRRIPIELISGEFFPKEVRSGEAAFVRWQAVENVKGCTGEYRRFFRDKSGKVASTSFQPMTYNSNWDPTHTHFDIPIIIPDMLEGDNTYWLEGARWCSKVQSWWPIPFISPVVHYKHLPPRQPQPIIILPN